MKQLKEKDDKVNENARHMKDLQMKIDELESKLVVKEEEKGKEFENAMEKVSESLLPCFGSFFVSHSSFINSKHQPKSSRAEKYFENMPNL